ncbi:MAG TPA: sugar ABC transporter permease [Jatrophihabitans sp.]|jgi:multiple sugar transport system permease protein|uniref:carbohydrate ABC transporter permease n=1 Tax=Jatrophihabitans sp. TaxID=1932789 RepID=UPI002F0E6048
MTSTASTSARRGRTRSLAQQESRAGLALIFPTVVIIFVVVIVPVLWTVMLAFQDIRLLNIRTAGIFSSYTLDNVKDVLSSPDLRRSLINTLVYTVGGTATSISLGMVAALAVRTPFRGRTIVRGVMLLPYVAPVVAATFVWQIMLDPQFGIVNHAGVNILGWNQAIPFLSEQTGQLSILGWQLTVPTALVTVIAFEAWRYFPFAFLFILARIQAMPGELEEAARVDGATPTQRFRHIIWPQLQPVIAMLAVLRFIWSFNKFDDVYLLTGGGAGTEVVSVRVYQLLTAQADVGGAAAQATVLAVILAICLTGYFLFFGRNQKPGASE